MIVIKIIIGVLFGLCGGLATAAGYFAVINSIGMLNRAASVTKTRDKLMLIEDVVVLGAARLLFQYSECSAIPKLAKESLSQS